MKLAMLLMRCTHFCGCCLCGFQLSTSWHNQIHFICMLVCDLFVHEVSLIFITDYISFFLASTLISIRCVWSPFAAFLFCNVFLLWFGFNSVHFISSGQFTYLEQKQFKKMYTSKSVLWLCTLESFLDLLTIM